jgi:hypothetical protein
MHMMKATAVDTTMGALENILAITPRQQQVQVQVQQQIVDQQQVQAAALQVEVHNLLFSILKFNSINSDIPSSVEYYIEYPLYTSFLFQTQSDRSSDGHLTNT